MARAATRNPESTSLGALPIAKQHQRSPLARFPNQAARLLTMVLISSSCALFFQAVVAQESNYPAVSLGELASDPAALAGQHVQTTGLLATTSDGAVLRTAPVDAAGLSVDLRGVPGDQLASLRTKCRFGCPATVRGMLAVHGNLARIIATAVLVE